MLRTRLKVGEKIYLGDGISFTVIEISTAYVLVEVESPGHLGFRTMRLSDMQRELDGMYRDDGNGG